MRSKPIRRKCGPPCLHGIDHQYNLFNSIPGGSLINMNLFVDNTNGIMGVGAGTTTWKAPTLTAYDPVQVTTDVVKMGIVNPGPQRGPCARYDLLLTTTGNPFGQSFGRICGWVDANGNSLGDLSLQANDGTGPSNYATVLTLNKNGATFPEPIVSTVANGTAPISVTSTTQVPNLNASEVGGVALSGLCQSSGAGCPSGLSSTFTITTTTGSCSFTYTEGKLMTKTGSC